MFFIKFWKFFGCYSVIFHSKIHSPLLTEPQLHMCWTDGIFPTIPWASVLFCSFFFLFFRLDNFYSSNFKFTDSFFCHQKSAVEPLPWLFHFSYCSALDFPFCFIVYKFIIYIHCISLITVSFNSSNVVLFNSLIVAVLKSSSPKSNSWERSETLPLTACKFFSPGVRVTFFFLRMSCTFVLTAIYFR